MKKIIALIVTLAMVLGLAVVPAFAVTNLTIIGSDAGEVLLQSGTQFNITFSIGENPGVSFVTVDITWPKEDIKLVGCDLKDKALPDYMTADVDPSNPGTFTLMLGNPAAKQNNTETGALTILTFEILEGASAGVKSIGIAYSGGDSSNITNCDLTPVATSFTAGKVTLVKAQYNVTFNPANGGESNTVPVEDGSTVTKPTDPQMEGYDFVEWQLNDAAYDFTTPVTAAIELTATYKIKKFNVTFNTAHGTAPGVQTIDWGAAVSKPADPSEEGWQFDGWMTTEGGTTPFDFSTPIKANTQIYAAWTKIHVHTPIQTPAKAATCTEAGNNEYWTCSDPECGGVFKDQACTQATTVAAETIAALTHSFGNPTYSWADDFSKVDASVSCTREGCTETITDTAAPVKVAEESKPATCTEDGKDVYKATFTKEQFTAQTKEKTITKLGHNMTPTVAKDATCTEAGNNAYYTCGNCNGVFKDAQGNETTTVEAETLPALNHSFGEPVYAWADDFSKVDASVSCTREGCTETITDTATPVKVAEESKPATCTEDGKDVYKATFTKEQFTAQTKEKTITKLGHNMTPTVAKDATCTEAGNNAYYTCGNCNGVFKDAQGNETTTVEAETLAALGHEPDEEKTITVNWNENDTAKIVFTCKRCGQAMNEDAEVTQKDNLLIASYGGKEYDRKHKDSVSINISGVKTEDGTEIALDEAPTELTDSLDDYLLTPVKAAAVTDDEVKDLKEEELTVVWQRDISVSSGGKITMTFTCDSIGPDDTLIIYHFDTTLNAWEIVGKGEKGSKTVTVTFNSLSPVALVVQSTTVPQTGDSSNVFIWTAAIVMAGISAAFVLMTSKKGKHEA